MEIVRLRLTTAAVAELILEARLLEPADAVRLGVVRELQPAGTALDGAVALAAQLAAYPQVVYAHAKEQLVRDALARIDAVSFDTELATARLWEAEESRAARRLQRARLEGRSE
jgi:enoyl-CoA hydratase/carnithine racemase